MIRRPRSESCSESAGDAKSGAKRDENTSASTKRKLSTSVSAQEQAKKTKRASEEPVNEDVTKDSEDDAEDGDEAEGDSEDEDDEDDSAKSVRTALDGKVYNIDGPGPHVFFLWSNAIHQLLDGMVDDLPYVVFKPSAIDAFKPVAHLSEDDAYEAINCKILKTWPINAVDGAEETQSAKALEKRCDELSKLQHARDEEDEDKMWWYEVMFQKEKPANDSPGIQVELEGAGTWWFVDIQPTDDEGVKAMTCIVQYTAHMYD